MITCIGCEIAAGFVVLICFLVFLLIIMAIIYSVCIDTNKYYVLTVHNNIGDTLYQVRRKEDRQYKIYCEIKDKLKAECVCAKLEQQNKD
jgi:cell division protein FtsL